MLIGHDHSTDHSAALQQGRHQQHSQQFHCVLPAMPPEPGLLGHRLLPSLSVCVQIHCTSLFLVLLWAMISVLALSQLVAVGCVLNTTKFDVVPTQAINNHSFSIISVFPVLLGSALCLVVLALCVDLSCF
jgi:hypothetical protein